MVPGNMILNADMKMKKAARGGKVQDWRVPKRVGAPLIAVLRAYTCVCIHRCVFRIILGVYPGP